MPMTQDDGAAKVIRETVQHNAMNRFLLHIDSGRHRLERLRERGRTVGIPFPESAIGPHYITYPKPEAVPETDLPELLT